MMECWFLKEVFLLSITLTALSRAKLTRSLYHIVPELILPLFQYSNIPIVSEANRIQFGTGLKDCQGSHLISIDKVGKIHKVSGFNMVK